MNEKFAHTPGPWVAAELLMHQKFIEIIHRGNKVGDSSTVLARVTYRPSWAVEQYANARLIASAPELLEALRKLVDLAEGGDVPCWADAWDDALAAIAKATGQTSEAA